jgi:hypothetical protein
MCEVEDRGWSGLLKKVGMSSGIYALFSCPRPRLHARFDVSQHPVFSELSTINSTPINSTEKLIWSINSRQGVVNQLNCKVVKACKP